MLYNRLQKGSATFFAIITLGLVLSIGLGLSIIVIEGIKLLQGGGKSTIALYAAESGIEHFLFDSRACTTYSCANGVAGAIGTVVLPNQSSYSVIVYDKGAGSCPATGVTFCAQSTGVFQNITRRIEIER